MARCSGSSSFTFLKYSGYILNLYHPNIVEKKKREKIFVQFQKKTRESHIEKPINPAYVYAEFSVNPDIRIYLRVIDYKTSHTSPKLLR